MGRQNRTRHRQGADRLTAGVHAATLTAGADNLAQHVDGSRLHPPQRYLTFHDAVIGRLLIAAGQSQKARERLEMALRHAEETGMHFHDAELMRVRAHTFAEPQERRNALAAALEFARHQGATLFELRCLLDAFDLLGDGDQTELAGAL